MPLSVGRSPSMGASAVGMEVMLIAVTDALVPVAPDADEKIAVTLMVLDSHGQFLGSEISGELRPLEARMSISTATLRAPMKFWEPICLRTVQIRRYVTNENSTEQSNSAARLGQCYNK